MLPSRDITGDKLSHAAILCVTIQTGGRTQIACNIPKLEAVKLLLSVVEELRVQAYEERERLIQVPSPQIERAG